MICKKITKLYKIICILYSELTSILLRYFDFKYDILVGVLFLIKINHFEYPWILIKIYYKFTTNFHKNNHIKKI